ncbi:MAG: SMP-30/gluconolactonase/LRE family protein [Planctomycetes bacterium]|nr:SMP-30/gluconolactonase/LRE family protein [Planctomycetota bacterium]
MTPLRPRVCRPAVLTVCVVAFAATPVGAQTSPETIEFDSTRWSLLDAETTTHLGRPVLCGTALLKDVAFTNGVIEVDVAVDGTRTYAGLIFRHGSRGDYEWLYLRPHRAPLYPDALQYTPVFDNVACWQLYTGAGYTAAASIPANQWIHLRLEVHGTQARLFIGDVAAPALEIHDLKHGLRTGSIGLLGPKGKAACFSNFRYRSDDPLEFAAPPAAETPTGTLTRWEVSNVFPARTIDTAAYPSFFQIFQAQWSQVACEPSGLVNISRHRRRLGTDADCVLARTVVQAARTRLVKLQLGYSDAVTVFLNGQPVFAGNNAYRSRDPSFVGALGLHDTVFLNLQKGLNEILLIVTETFGGWGFMCQADRDLAGPVKQHEALTKVWETPAEFKIPESVLYDRQRDILYVSSFDKVANPQQETGFISRVSLDGQIKELRWVTGLDGPCGLALCGERLYVVEGVRKNLVEIDADTGEILRRYPVRKATFLNDIIPDQGGALYISDSSRVLESSDIHRFADGRVTTWLEGAALHRSNGLYVHSQDLLVGCTGDGCLKAVDLSGRHVRDIACLGAGVVDGIRVDGAGNYLVSHWEGQLYRVSPAGEVTEILDTMAAGENCADFEFVADRDLLVVPTFLGNKVCAYRLNQP